MVENEPGIPLVPAPEFERRRRRRESDWPELWSLLDMVKDPEIPALSLWDLGVLQDIDVVDGEIVVTITPTYSGCPAMRVMAEDIEAAIRGGGHEAVRVDTRLSPAWTTDWMSTEARTQLREVGISPPDEQQKVNCPLCGSEEVQCVSEFGSTACKALYTCKSCSEPFDYFKYI